jgi:hypothetical protein
LASDGGSSTKSVEFHNDHQKLVEPSDPLRGPSRKAHAYLAMLVSWKI